MRKILFAAVGFAALAGVGGLALAQGNATPPRAGHHLFQGDANTDGVLTRAEFDAARQARFAQQDANNDGQLTREEMRAGHGEGGHHGRGWGRRGGMHMLARADANNDGNVTRDEYLAGPIASFDRLDANNDGVISEAERPQRPERGERGERHGRMDGDGDRQISRAEFDAMGARMFERLDANSDGRVTREEADAARAHRRGRD